MAWYYGNYGEPIYVPNGEIDPRFYRDGLFYQDPAPVSFRTPPSYDDDVVCYRRSFRDQHPHDDDVVCYRRSFRDQHPHDEDVVCYRRSFRDQHPHFSHGGELIIPAREQVYIRSEDPYVHPYSHSYPSTSTAPWWLDGRNHPHHGVYPGDFVVVERPHCTGDDDDDDDEDHLEFYAPQLCSDSRQRKVVDALKAFPGVENVVADQWEMKVVVVGSGLCEKQVLRRLQLVPHMERSVFWRDRR